MTRNLKDHTDTRRYRVSDPQNVDLNDYDNHGDYGDHGDYVDYDDYVYYDDYGDYGDYEEHDDHAHPIKHFSWCL